MQQEKLFDLPPEKNKKKQKIKILDFSSNHNSKLSCDYFLCVFLPNWACNKNDIFSVRIKDTHLFFARIQSKKAMTLSEILDNDYNFMDLGLDQKDYLDQLNAKFKTKSLWSKDLKFKVIIFAKITQLTIFENGEYDSN